MVRSSSGVLETVFTCPCVSVMLICGALVYDVLRCWLGACSVMGVVTGVKAGVVVRSESLQVDDVSFESTLSSLIMCRFGGGDARCVGGTKPDVEWKSTPVGDDADDVDTPTTSPGEEGCCVTDAAVATATCTAAAACCN